MLSSFLKQTYLHFKQIDWLLVVAIFLLSAVSLIFLCYLGEENSFYYFKKQLFFIISGFLLMLIVSFFDYRVFRNYSPFLIALYLLVLVTLAAVLFLGENIRGTTGWFNVGSINFSPVELTKLVIILLLAKYFSLRHIEMYQIRHLIASFIYISLPVLLVLFQPDFGSALVLLMIWLGLVIIAGIKFRHLLVILLMGLIIFTVMWSVILKEYQKKRILTFINPQKDPLGYSYNLQQSIIAIGSGKIFGKGLGKGTQSQLGFLPESHTDFIFAGITEDTGFIGVVMLFSIFAFVIYRIIKIGFLTDNNFAKLFALGISLMLVLQILINTGMNLGLLPIIGIPLPFISYGGSATIVNFLSLGILQSIKAKSSFQRATQDLFTEVRG